MQNGAAAPAFLNAALTLAYKKTNAQSKRDVRRFFGGSGIRMEKPSAITSQSPSEL